MWTPGRGCSAATWGRKHGGAQHRFYLGRDRAKATLANQRLDLLWDAVKAYCARYRDGETPVWDDTTLTIAQAVARGEFNCSVDVPAYV